ncbi:MAG: hypothetical protein ACE5LU_03495 [Anaerolineae bacterium]
MRILLWLVLATTIAGCSAPLPAREPAAPMSSPVPNAPRADDFRKLGPELRRRLLQRGRQALEAPETLNEQLRPVTVVIQARRDITEELEDYGVRVRSVTQNAIVVITADVPPAAIPSLLTLPELETIELTQPVPPAGED